MTVPCNGCFAASSCGDGVEQVLPWRMCAEYVLRVRAAAAGVGCLTTAAPRYQAT